jgi:hypothetical protein
LRHHQRVSGDVPPPTFGGAAATIAQYRVDIIA